LVSSVRGTFFRVNPQYATYMLSGRSLDRITLVNDLGVPLDPRLKIADHISSMVKKSLSLLKGGPYITKTLFIPHVRPILEYGSPVPNTEFILIVSILYKRTVCF